MTTILAKDLDHTHISKVVKFTVPDPALVGYKQPNTPKITVVGVLSSFVKSNVAKSVVLHVGNGKYSIDETWQELLEISFPAEV